MKNTIFLFLLLFALAGCVEPYHAKTEGVGNILVVEGFITNGITQISLSYSIHLDLYLRQQMHKENQAVVYVECDDGTKSEPAHSSGKGIYLIETGELNVDVKYRLVIQLNGEEYRSSYIAPVITPPVNVTFTHDKINRNINLCVTTIGNMHQHGYYLWSYREDWEIHALRYEREVPVVPPKQIYHASRDRYDWEMMLHDINAPNNVYYCWRTDSSKVYKLGATEKLSENAIREKKLWTFSCADDRTSVLYRVKIKQNALHKEGYDYFENVQKIAEQTGSIFSSIPSELRGNIRCESSPGIPVIGYVDVSTTTTDVQYLTDIYYDWSFYLLLVDSCQTASPKSDIYRYANCTNCTSSGTKRKPNDWPNDHQ